jgi:phosphohistidine phosphatase
MARQLWLLRHAEAEPHGSRPDAERRLTERGERQARAAGIVLERIGVKFDAILFSPKVRARQTAELAAEAWSADQRTLLREHAPLSDGFDAPQALEALAEVGSDGCVLLVGHEPDLSRVAGELTGGRLVMKKGGVAALRLDGPGGELLVLMRPRELGLIAGVPAGRD